MNEERTEINSQINKQIKKKEHNMKIKQRAA
jgi:hypothetical protein